MCQLHMHIPTNPDYSSLNLAAAVQVVAYECRMWALEEKVEVGEASGWDMPLADAADVERMHQHMAKTLAAINFIDPDNPKQALTRLRRMFARIRPDEMEISILRGMLNKIDRVAARNKAD